jgi:hypothetical protein
MSLPKFFFLYLKKGIEYLNKINQITQLNHIRQIKQIRQIN